MRPFEGIRIVDFTQAHAGSLATMLLADMGAEVIKIERAGTGDLARYWAPFRNGNSGYYAFLNRGKKSMSLNLATQEGKEIVKKLIATADVVCENFKFGSMARMGLSYEAVSAIKPDIIYASLNGFGQTGPMRETIGLDLQLQAMSGVMDATGFPAGDPVRVGVAFGDHLSGTYMALGVALALIERQQSGRGQYIDIAILDALFSLMQGQVSQGGGRHGNCSTQFAPCDCYQVSDGYLLIQVTQDDQWDALCRVLGLGALAGDPALKSNSGRMACYDTRILPVLAERLASCKKLDAETLLQSAGVPCSAVRTVQEATASPRAAGLLAELHDPALGKVHFPGSHFHIDRIDTQPTRPAPLQGEHTLAYLTELGYHMDEMAALLERGVAEWNGGEIA